MTQVAIGLDYFGLLQGDGTGAFVWTTVPHVDPCDPQQTCRSQVEATLDVNDDGLMDVLVRHQTGTSSQARQIRGLRLADGAGGFGQPLPVDDYRVGTAPAIHFGDVTDDGLVDLLTIHSADSLLRLRRGDGAGGFGPETTSPSPSRSGLAGIRIQDVTGDGHGDLVLSGGCVVGNMGQETGLVGCVRVMPGDGSGSFASVLTYLASDVEVDGIHPVDVGDFDEDGSLDIAGANFGQVIDGGGTVGSISLFLGDGAGGFEPEISVPASEQTIDVDAGDFDGDGHVDLFTTLDRGDYRGKVLFGTGTGGFSDSHLLPDGTDNTAGLVTDLVIGDRPELVTTKNNAVRIY